MTTAHEVAKWFLHKDSMTHKKLQKLCYYAQAWYCALYDGSPLFSEEIQAWVHGPVVPSLYQIYSSQGWTPIAKEKSVIIFDDKIADVLEAVYNTYGNLTGDQLESLTHSEKPWIEARKQLKPWEISTATIPCCSMRDFYLKEYERYQND